MGWIRRFDESAAIHCAECIEPHRDQLKTLWMKLFAQFLPHGQVPVTSSVGSPGIDKNFLSFKAGEFK